MFDNAYTNIILDHIAMIIGVKIVITKVMNYYRF